VQFPPGVKHTVTPEEVGLDEGAGGVGSGIGDEATRGFPTRQN
jgi:hypothetical protein